MNDYIHQNKHLYLSLYLFIEISLRIEHIRSCITYMHAHIWVFTCAVQLHPRSREKESPTGSKLVHVTFFSSGAA